MTQRDFDADLNIKFDDTGDFMKFPEQEEGFWENPIRRIFEGDDIPEED
jgi:hypothetical protein